MAEALVVHPPVRPATLKVRNAFWIRNPIDGFILRQIESAEIHLPVAVYGNTSGQRISGIDEPLRKREPVLRARLP